MKKLFFTTSMLLSIAAYSQVGVNTDTPKGTLDVTAKKTDGTTAEGFIAPRLTGDQIKAADAQYGTAQKGIIIYATAAVGTSSTKTANITSEGYYYFDGSLWQKVSGAASGWGLTGNTGTTASTAAIGSPVNNNFIGTKDAQDLVVASNNQEVLRATSTGNVGIGISTPDKKLVIKSGTAGASGLKFSDMTSTSPSTPDAGTLGIDASGNVVIHSKAPVTTVFKSFSIDNNAPTASTVSIGSLEFRYNGNASSCVGTPPGPVSYLQIRTTTGANNTGIYHAVVATTQTSNGLGASNPMQVTPTFSNFTYGLYCVNDHAIAFNYFSYTDRTFYRVNVHVADGDNLGFGAQGYIFVEYQK